MPVPRTRDSTSNANSCRPSALCVRHDLAIVHTVKDCEQRVHARAALAELLEVDTRERRDLIRLQVEGDFLNPVRYLQPPFRKIRVDLLLREQRRLRGRLLRHSVGLDEVDLSLERIGGRLVILEEALRCRRREYHYAKDHQQCANRAFSQVLWLHLED